MFIVNAKNIIITNDDQKQITELKTLLLHSKLRIWESYAISWDLRHCVPS